MLTAAAASLGILAALARHSGAQQVVTVSAADQGIHHVEPQLASDPRDPREIVVAAMRVRSTDLATWEVVAFRSTDGGQHWRPSALPAKAGVRCAADPWVAWGRDRSVYVACLAPVPSPDGKDFHFDVFLHRSPDAGRTWAEPLQVPVDRVGEWDHPVLVRAPAVTDTARDILWIAGARPRRGGNEFGVVRYMEEGDRFDSMRVYRPPESANHSFGSAAAIDGDRLTFTYFTMSQQPPRPLYAVYVSPEGFQRTPVRESVTPWGFPMLTAGRGAGRQSGTLAAVWLEGTQAAGLDVVMAQSDDAGRTWMRAQVVTADQPRVFRTRPNLAWDGHGAVAVTWFESPSGSPCGDVHVRILDVRTSRVLNDHRLARGATGCPTDQPLSGIVERWRGGGDYAGIQGVGPGAFDVVWADVREDGHHVRFARVRPNGRPNAR